MASEDTHTLTVRAGRYAVVDGVTYKCVQYFDDSPIWLSVRYDEPRPAGFTDAPGGGWRRRVLPEEIPELIEITTTARWRDRSVIVRGVSGDSAFIKDGGQDHYVPVADLTEVIEQTVQLPLPPIGSAWVDGPVRAGLYAIYQGKAYATLGPTHSSGDRHKKPILWLWAPPNEPQPDGFEPARRGGWRRSVPLEDVTAAFGVRTTARWRGNPVSVLLVRGDWAAIQYMDWEIDDGRPELTYQQHGMWEGSVPVDSLTHVIQLPRDFVLKAPPDRS